MKKLLLLHLLLAMFLGVQTVKADVVLSATNFPDANFRTYISQKTGVSVGGIISDATLASITNINTSYKNISSLQGIEYFTELTELVCRNNNLTSLDLSKNTKLTYLNCESNQLISLDVSKNTNLTELLCYRNQLTSLDVSKNTVLTQLNCSYNQLTSLDVSKNAELKYLYCNYNQLTSLDVSKNTKLTDLNCCKNQLTSIDVSKNTELTWLIIEHNQFTSLDVSKNTKLLYLSCSDNQLTSLDVSKNIALTRLYCNANQLTSLDVRLNTNLITLECIDNQLASLDVSNNTKLRKLACSSNNIGTLYLIKNTELEILDCASNKIDQLNLSNNTKLTTLMCTGNRLTNLKLDDNTALTYSDEVNVGSQSSTRRFQIDNYNSNVHNCWSLYVGTNDVARIRSLRIDGVSKTPKLVHGDWLIVSDDLKKIPLKVEYEIYTGNEAAGWMPVTVNYDVRRYGVYIDDIELTSLNFYDIPGLKEGTAYFLDEHYDLGWSGKPILVLENATLEINRGNYGGIAQEGGQAFRIIVKGDCTIKVPNNIGIYMDYADMFIEGGGKLHLSSKYACFSSWIGSELTIQDNTVVIAESEMNSCYYSEEWDTFTIKDGGVFVAKSKYEPITYADKPVFGDGIDIRYPAGAYLGDDYIYNADGTKVSNGFVIIGPDNQATQDLIATGIQDLKDLKDSKDLKVYNLAGQRLSKTQRGINIVGGKKIIRE